MSKDAIDFLRRVGREKSQPEIAEEANRLADELEGRRRGFSAMAYCQIGVPVLLYLPTATDKFGVFELKEDSVGLHWEDEEGRWLAPHHKPVAFIGLDNLEGLAKEAAKEKSWQI